MVGLGDFARLTTLLARATRIPDPPRPHPRVREDPGRKTSGGLVYDWFEPVGPNEAIVIPLHGCTLNGKDDPRLQHFARCLARAGASCAVPTLPGLSNMDWTGSDLDHLEELIATLVAQSGQAIGLIGFSFAGSPACAARSA